MTSAMRNLLLVGFMLVFALGVTVLSLSDRAPGMVLEVKDLATELGQRGEARFGIDVVDRDDVPGEFDQVGHAVMWGLGMFGLGLLLRRRVPLVLLAMFLTAASIGFELLQALYTSSRALEPSDAVANAVGIGIALMAVTILGALFDWILAPLARWLRLI